MTPPLPILLPSCSSSQQLQWQLLLVEISCSNISKIQGDFHDYVNNWLKLQGPKSRIEHAVSFQAVTRGLWNI